MSTMFKTSRRPRLRWLDQEDLKKMKDLKKMNVINWREKCTDRRLWNEIVKCSAVQSEREE
jgi:hypothetical protein